jgi:hypothetical protein
LLIWVFPIIEEETCMKTLTVMVMALSVLASACSTVDDASYSYKDGSRQAQIVEIGTGNAVVPLASKDCRGEGEGHALDARHAVISYSYGESPNLRRKRVVALPDGFDASVGDWIYVSVKDCKLAPRHIDARQRHL